MNIYNILEFLMENDVILKSTATGNCMTADAAFELNGEFVVYDNSRAQNDLYRGDDFDKALRVLVGEK